MKKILFAILITAITIFNAMGYAAEEPPVAIDPAIASPESSGPVVKRMQGRISGVSTTQKSFKIAPDNVGEPISVTCETGLETCKTDGLIDGVDGQAELYLQDGKWIAKSVTQKS